MRLLFSIPILHTQTDLGTLGARSQQVKLAKLGRQGLLQSADLVDKSWEAVEAVVQALEITPGKTRVYQDGLPVCGHERRIVADLAAAGSRNHRLLLALEARGALLMGTESPELLVEEYRLAREALAPGAARSARREQRQKPRRDALLEKRDRFIARRINGTLGAGETGILFLGMLHAVERYLDPDIQVMHPCRP